MKWTANKHEVCPESFQPCTMRKRGIYSRRYKKHCTQDNDASVPFKVGTLGPHTVLPVAISCPIVFSWIPLTVWSHPSLSKVILVLGKSRRRRTPNLGFRGPESPGWFDVLPKNSAWDVMHEWAHCHDEAANHQLPITAAFWIIWIVSVEECSSLVQNSMEIYCFTCSFWMQWPHMLTQQHLPPHWLVQWSCHCSRMHFQSILLGCQVTSMSHKLFSLH